MYSATITMQSEEGTITLYVSVDDLSQLSEDRIWEAIRNHLNVEVDVTITEEL